MTTEHKPHSSRDDFAVVHNALGTGEHYADEPRVKQEMLDAFAALRRLEEQLQVVRELYDLRYQSWSATEEELWKKALGV